MKLRCTDNSIRIRIRKSELKKLVEEKFISSYVNFGISTFSFSLYIADVDFLNAHFEKNEIKVLLPEVKAMVWANSDQVSMETENEINENEKLHILVEKDFPCKDRPEENKEDTFWELDNNSEKC